MKYYLLFKSNFKLWIGGQKLGVEILLIENTIQDLIKHNYTELYIYVTQIW